MIISISGFATSGKDTVAKIIQELVIQNKNPDQDLSILAPEGREFLSGWQIKSWAGKLKDIASLLTGIPRRNFDDQEFKKSFLGPEWDFVGPSMKSGNVVTDDLVQQKMSVRLFLQLLGTDAIRDGLHRNTWVNALMADYGNGEIQKLLIPDSRFINELQAVRDSDGLTIRVDRPGIIPMNHPSEKEHLLWDKWGYIIENNSSVEDLVEKVKQILIKENII